MAAGTVTSLLLATLAVAPVSAQSSSGNGQGSDQNQEQGMNQGNNQNGNGQNQSGQNQGQGSCAAFAQSMGQGMSQGNNQNGNGQNGNNGQAALGTGPGNAATPMANCWLSIGPGQKQWYKFHVGARSNKGDENNNFDNANGIDDSDAAIAQLTMDTQGCIAFEIWTQERLNAAQSGVKDDDKLLGPVGAGSPEFAINHNNDNSSDDNSSSANSDKNLNHSRLLWRGGSTVREDFLLVVRNLRSDFACSYRLSVAGPTVSFPGANNGGNNVANGNNNGNNGSNNNNGNNGNNGSNNNGSNGDNNGSNNNGGSNSNNNNG